MCEGENGERYNVNVDTAAMAVAQSLGAEKLVFLSDVMVFVEIKKIPTRSFTRLGE